MLPFELALALRYLRPKRTFVSAITLISIIGVTLGVAVLIIVMSVMSGFDLMLRERLLNFNSHIKVFTQDRVMTEYRELRETAPIYRSPGLRIWMVSRYTDAVDVLRSKSFCVARNALPLGKLMLRQLRDAPDLLAILEHNLLSLDPPRHTRLRGLVSKAFTPRRVAQLRPRVESLVDELLDRVAGAEEMELVRDLAKNHGALVTVEEGSIGGFASHVLQFLALDGLLDGNLKVRPMTLPDVPIDHGNYDKQINDAGLSASHIASTALSLMGQKAEAMEVLAAVTSK